MNAARTATVATVLAAAAALPAASTPAPAARPVAAVAPVAQPHVHDGSPTHVSAKPAAKPKVKVKAQAARKPAPVWDGTAFTSPEAAMRFLVRAYNAHGDRALRHVTTPDARSNLVAMRGYAPALRLTSCTRLESGAYDCEFAHTLADRSGWGGYASFRVAPAAEPGWYMTVLMECGDGESA